MTTVFGIFPVGFVLAQQADQIRDQAVFSAIDRAHQNGQINTDQQVLYKFYVLYNRDELPRNLQTDSTMPIKCGTPAIVDFIQKRDELSPAITSEIEQLIQQSTQQQADETYTSPSGHFTIHYDTSGEDAPPQEDSNSSGVPDYVEEVAAAADSSYRHQVQNLGYTDFLLPASTYDIYILNLESIYGRTRVINFGTTTEIDIENDFSENFPPNDDPEGDQIGAIKVTIAHEIKHAVQYANNEWQGSAGSFNWSEMDATLMEEVVYDNVNDYYNYLSSSNSIFNTPNDGIPGAYWHVSWSIFFEEYFGSQFWVDVWQEIDENATMNFLDAIANQVNVRDENFTEIFAKSHLWHYASGPNLSPINYGFEERQNYPGPAISQTINGIGDFRNSPYSMGQSGARYFKIQPTGNEQNQLSITLEGDTTHYTAGVIAYFNNGSTQTLFEISPSTSGELTIETPWSWTDLSEVGVVALNTSEDNVLEAGIKTESYQAQFVTLEQNYPNPFNPVTTIEFTLLEETDVQLKIYDVTGRLVRTVVDETRSAGPHSETFDASGLASGIYIYQLVSDEKVLDRKMTFIK